MEGGGDVKSRGKKEDRRREWDKRATRRRRGHEPLKNMMTILLGGGGEREGGCRGPAAMQRMEESEKINNLNCLAGRTEGPDN
jgi:hypothetical protein